jgi:hypothetical protein
VPARRGGYLVQISIKNIQLWITYQIASKFLFPKREAFVFEPFWSIFLPNKIPLVSNRAFLAHFRVLVVNRLMPFLSCSSLFFDLKSVQNLKKERNQAVIFYKTRGNFIENLKILQSIFYLRAKNRGEPSFDLFHCSLKNTSCNLLKFN